ncbi:hypothetical protein [Pseudomonas panipatensis]|uniref:hypothetical protein n=1 Tax=Pseudomonas panipatensis TaxID=428992 RepID=UPI0035B25625
MNEPTGARIACASFQGRQGEHRAGDTWLKHNINLADISAWQCVERTPAWSEITASMVDFRLFQRRRRAGFGRCAHWKMLDAALCRRVRGAISQVSNATLIEVISRLARRCFGLLSKALSAALKALPILAPEAVRKVKWMTPDGAADCVSETRRLVVF